MRDFSRDAPSTCIYTVGYEKTDQKTFIDRLIASGIDVLVDVRERPISRKKGFSKKALSEAITAAGIQYVHVQALGDPKPGRDAARAGQHAKFVEIFCDHMRTDGAQSALKLLAVETFGKNICLACFERDHECCHRAIVADQLAAITGESVKHLMVTHG